MKVHTLISVVIPCYNQGRFLAQALDSVLAQNHKEVEVIVVDDGSTDTTQSVAARYTDVVYLRQENQGLAAARNTGLGASRGEFLVFLDADDRLLPQAFEIALQSFADHPDSAFVAGQVSLISAEGLPLPSPPAPELDGDLFLELLRHNFIWSPGAVMYRRRAFDLVKGFNTSVDASADFDLHIRIASRMPVYWHGAAVLEYRRHAGSMSRRAALMLKSSVRARRSHRKLVKGNLRYEEALSRGISSVQQDYGEKTMCEFWANLRRRKWNTVLKEGLIILRYYPQGFVAQTSRKLYRTICKVRGV
jgi:glycosyltransferase involved in cell wall biosynthesis